MRAVRAHLSDLESVFGTETVYGCGELKGILNNWLVVVAESGASTRDAQNTTGANRLVHGDDYLQFRIGARATNKATHCRVQLVRDEYTVTFRKIRGAHCRQISEAEMVGVENLRQVFTSATGFDCTLGTMGNRGESRRATRPAAHSGAGRDTAPQGIRKPGGGDAPGQ